MGRLYNLTVVQFNPQKREFSLLPKVALPLYLMLGYVYNRIIMLANIITVLLNIHLGQGQGEEGKKRATKQQHFPTLLTMTVAIRVGLKVGASELQVQGSNRLTTLPQSDTIIKDTAKYIRYT